MQILVLVARKRLWTTLALLHTALSTDRNLGATLPFHLLERITSRSDEQTEKVNLGELFYGDIDLFLGAARAFLHQILWWGPEVGICLHGPFDEALKAETAGKSLHYSR
jgi:hypothetical protein